MYINGDLSLVSSDLEPSKKEGDLRRLEMLLWRDCGASYYWGFLACNNQGKQLINRYYIDLLIGLKVWMHVPVRWSNLFLAGRIEGMDLLPTTLLCDELTLTCFSIHCNAILSPWSGEELAPRLIRLIGLLGKNCAS